MKEDTGKISEMSLEAMEELNKHLKPGKQHVAIPEDQLPRVRKMNRFQRRLWAARVRRATKR
jgi:hypothetical protein